MATFNLINDWLDNMVENADLASDQFTVALSNTAPGSEGTPPTGDGAGILGNVTQVSYTNLSARTLTTASSSQTAGTYSLVLNDLVLTASGAVATFRYVYIYDDTVTVPVDPLVCYYDYGSGLTLANGETLTIDFGTELFTIS
jgi:hypothetical protein